MAENFPYSKDVAAEKIESLVNKFSRGFNRYVSKDFEETPTRVEFINPFFTALGWDVTNDLTKKDDQYKDVVHEANVYVKEDRERKNKKPDYAFRVNGKEAFFLEAKPPHIKLDKDKEPAFQARRYGFAKNHSISILNNFEDLAIYECLPEPKITDSPSKARAQYYHYTEYLKNLDGIWDLLARENVINGSIQKFGFTKKKGIKTVDDEFLEDIERWRKKLALNITDLNKKIDEVDLNYVVQQTLDRIIFLRIAEDRDVEPYEALMNCLNTGNYYQNIFRLFKEADDRYNSGLFDFRKDTVSEKIKIDNKVVKNIIDELYYPNCPFAFNIMPVEIIGSAYERFLGSVIRLRKSHTVVIEEKPEVKKAKGVYYTPQYIIEYICKNTVGKAIDGKTPQEISKIKILDPACGSGSFLLGAYQTLLDYHLDYYMKLSEKQKVKELTPNGTLTSQVKKQILLNNIHGVDIDANAVEVTKLSLLLKALEGETQASVNYQLQFFKERVLPSLENNIKCGNSLIDKDFDAERLDFGDKKVNSFNWETAFPTVFEQGGGVNLI